MFMASSLVQVPLKSPSLFIIVEVRSPKDPARLYRNGLVKEAALGGAGAWLQRSILGAIAELVEMGEAGLLLYRLEGRCGGKV